MVPIDLKQKKKIGLVCSGGAVKAAAFHVGVAMALERRGFSFVGGILGEQKNNEVRTNDNSHLIQTYVGSSAGSLVSTFLAQGGKLKDLESSFFENSPAGSIPAMKYWEMIFPRVKGKNDFLSPDNFIFRMFKLKTFQSPFSTHGISRYLKNYVIKSDKFSDLEADLFVVATEVNQSRKTIFGKYLAAPTVPYTEYRNDVAISDACAASMAFPPLYHPYSIQIEGQKRDYFDGEIREPLSSHIARDVGCDLIICSYTHQPLRMHASQGSLADKGIQEVFLQAIYQSIEQKIQVSRGYRDKEKGLIDQVRKFFIRENLSKDLCEKLIEELQARMTYKANVDYIYIRPRPSDYEMFSLPHFSLNKTITEKIARKGFLAAMVATQKISFESKTERNLQL